MTAVNALSSEFVLRSYRKGKEYSITFQEGKEIEERAVTGGSAKVAHGLSVTFTPSKFYLGKDTEIPIYDVIKWLTDISYFIKEKIKFTIEIFDGFKLVETINVKSKSPVQFLKDKVDEPISTIGHITGSIDVIEESQNMEIPRVIYMDLTFVYSNDITPYVNSFCNNINTVNGGLHLDTAKDCLCRILQNETKKSLNATEQKKLDILYVDVLQGLNYAVNLETDMNVQFSAQVKSTLTNEQLVKPMRAILNAEIANFFNENKTELDKLVKIVKLNAKARIEVNKVKTAIVNEKLNVFAEHKMKNFAPANNRGKNQYREIFLIEGDSAKGSAMLARDPDTQAVFAFRGVTLNAFKNSLADIMNNKVNPEYRDLVKVLKCGIGETFNMDRFHYDKIIIMTDADIDGAGITSLISAFFVLYYPELVKAGKIYKVLPPLYGTSDKKDKYILNKAHYSEKVLTNIKKAYKLKLPMSPTTNGTLSEDELKDFILDIKDYKDTIKYMNTRFKIESLLIERILSHIAFVQMKYFNNGVCTWNDIEEILLDPTNNSEFIQYIREIFPELSIHGLNIHGIVNGGYRTVTLSRSFFDNGREVIKTIKKYGPMVDVKEKRKDNTSLCSILEFISISESCYPDIISRYKGLGEQDPKELKETTMNPLGRRLIQLTCSDYDTVLEQFKVLHSDEAKYAQLRKDMVNAYKISKDDLDN